MPEEINEIIEPAEELEVTVSEEPEESMSDRMKESMAKTDSVKLWVLFNVFVSIVNLAFAICMFVLLCLL